GVASATTPSSSGAVVGNVGAVSPPPAAEQPPGDAATPAAATPPTAVRFVIVPMHLLPAPTASGENARVDLELRADGMLYSHGQFVGQLSGNRVLGANGREILS